MPAARKNNWVRSILLCGCALGAWGWILAGGAHAQSASPGKDVGPSASTEAASQPGGLDMDVNPTAPAPVASQDQPGGLDMDVNPAAPARAPAPVVAGTPTIQALSRDNVQDGIRTAPVAPAPDETPSAAGQPDKTQPATVIATPAAPVAQPEPVNLDRPAVIDTATLKGGDTVVALYGIEGMQGEAAQGLQGFLTSIGGHLTCQAQSTSGSVCLLPDGTDVAEVALVNGAARAKDDAPDAYRDQEAAAQAARRGIWSNLPPPPVTLKHPVVRDTATLAADGQTYVLNGVLGLGAPYAGQLQGYIVANGDSLSCQPQIEPGQYICMLSDGTDIAKVALVNGAARVSAEAPDSYRMQQGEALNNRRGFWLNPPPDVLLAVSTVQTAPVCCAFEPGDDGVDGVTYVGGVPEAVIGGESVFLVFGGALGWGYYDHWHHWHGAPDRYRHHLERFHAEGHGLRGYGHDEALRRDAVMHREEAVRRGEGLRHEAVVHPGVAHPAGMAEHLGAGAPGHPGFPGAPGHPGFAGAAGHPGFPGAPGHPGFAGAPGHPGFAGAAGHPGFAGGAGHPAMAGGFVHPGPSVGGFHPGAAPMAHAPMAHAAAPAVHASAVGKRK